MNETGPAHHAAAERSGAPRGASITDFLTDGSIVRLCAALDEITPARFHLLDADGMEVVPAQSPDDPEPWTVRPPRDIPDGGGVIRAPILLGDRSIGVFVVEPGGSVTPEKQGLLRVVGEQLASLSAEFCTEASQMRTRIRELEALFRLSALLATQADTIDQILRTALALSLDVLGLDAGSIVLFPEGARGIHEAAPEVDSEAEVVTRASINLSEDWLSSTLPLSAGRVFDRLVLEGHTLAIPDLLDDPRVLAPERCEREGLRSFLSAALMHREQPIGVIRVYGRDVRVFSVEDQRLLRSIGEQAAVAVAQSRLIETERREREMERQVQLASAVQRRMMPRDLPEIPGLDVAARSEPSRQLGGDLYDLFEFSGGSLAMVIGDVVGKGLPAALLMSAVRAGLRAHAASTDTLERLVSRVNNDLCRDSLPNEFTTLWVGGVDPATRVLTYCPAGHEPPLLIRPARRGEPPTREDVSSLCIGGLVIGISPDEPYKTMKIDLRPGDVLVAYTDGVTDARNFQNEKWGWDRLADAAVEALTQQPDAGASMVLDNILWSLRRFVGLSPQVDDETLIVLRVLPE